jgi:branched-chain amino acid transport system ATP-binding protein
MAETRLDAASVALLEVRRLTAGYDRHAVVHDLDLTVGEGEIVALVGANGAGKSTLLKAISGLLAPQSGQILLGGRPIGAEPPRHRVLLGIAHVPEGRQVFGGLSIEENLRLGAYAHRERLGASGMRARIAQVCESFPVLVERTHQPAGNLSGGQQQMLAIARGLMAQPKILLLDEPSLGLSPILVADIFRLIKDLRSQGIAILLSEQNARLSLQIADRGYVIESGRVVIEGAGRQLLGQAEVVERYLGVGKGVAAADAQRHGDLVARLQSVLST